MVGQTEYDNGGDGPGPSPRLRRQARRKEEIFGVAVGLFAKKGYDGVTVEEIAAAVDIAKGTFFNYFPSKEHLLVEYRRSLLNYIHDYGDTLVGDSARELVRDYFRTMARKVCAEGERYETLFKEVVARPHLFTLDRSPRDRYRAHFDRFIAIGKRSGEVPESCDTRLLAETIRDLWTGTSSTWLIEKPAESLEVLILQKIDLLFDLLDTQTKREPEPEKETPK